MYVRIFVRSFHTRDRKIDLLIFTDETVLPSLPNAKLPGMIDLIIEN